MIAAAASAASVLISHKQTALRFVNTSFMRLDGVVVEGARQRGIHILASKNISLRNLTVRNVGSMGVHVERGWNVTLADSTVEHTGGTAVDVNQAGTPAQTPWTSPEPIPNLQGTANDGQVRTLTPGGNAVLGNTLRFFGRICHAYRPGVMSNGTAVTIAGNEIAFGPHAGMLPSGNDNLIERNAFHHLVMQVWFSGLWKGNKCRILNSTSLDAGLRHGRDRLWRAMDQPRHGCPPQSLLQHRQPR